MKTLFLGTLFTFLLCSQTLFAEPIKIGVSLPLTGPAATYGADIKNVLNFLKERDKRTDFEYLFEDDKCDPKEAVSIAQKFVDIGKVKAVTGLPCSGTVLASAPIYERNHVVAMSIGAGAPSISGAGDYIFRSRPSDTGAALVLGSYLEKKGVKVAVLAEEMEMPQGFADALGKQLQPNQVVGRDGFASGTADLSPILLRIKARNPGGLVLVTQAERTLISLVKAIRDMKWNVQIYGSIFPGSHSFLEAMHEQANGIIYVSLPARYSLNSEGNNLLQEFEKQYGKLNSADYAFTISYAAYRAITQTMTQPDPKAYLYATEFAGVTGPFGFDEKGDLRGMNYELETIVNENPTKLLNQ